MEQKTCMQEGTSSYVGNALLYLRQTTLPLRNTPNQTNALNIELCICQWNANFVCSYCFGFRNWDDVASVSNSVEHTCNLLPEAAPIFLCYGNRIGGVEGGMLMGYISKATSSWCIPKAQTARIRRSWPCGPLAKLTARFGASGLIGWYFLFSLDTYVENTTIIFATIQ